MSHDNVEGYLHVVHDHDPMVFTVMWQTYMAFNVMQCVRKSALWTDQLYVYLSETSDVQTNGFP